MFVVIVHVTICLFLVAVILLQPGKSDGGIAFGGGSSQSIFGSRGAGNFLTKTTTVCAVLFLGTSLFLTWDRVHTTNRSVIGDEPKVETKAAAPKAPEVPAAKTEALPKDSPKAN